MSNQEQQFYNSEHYPPPQQQQGQYYEERSNVNVDPREQQQQMMYSGHEYYTGPGEKLQPQMPRRRRKGFRLFWLAPVVLLFLIGAMGYGFGHHARFAGYSKDSGMSRFFTVTAPKLVVNDNVVSVHIHSNGDNSNSKEANGVTIQVEKSNSSEPDPVIDFDKGSGTITIRATEQGFNSDSIDIDITTPRTSDVQLNDSNGSVTIEGITGNIDAHTANGSVTADNIAGQATLSAASGSVDVSDSQLSGTSSLHSNDGSISYKGSLDIHSTYTFVTDNGSVNVSLPNDAAFDLKAYSGSGSINNDFGSYTVGGGTRASLTLHTGDGSVNIHKG